MAFEIFSLVIPYFIWNILCMLFDIVCSYSFLKKYFIGHRIFEITPMSLFRGVFLHWSNIPFWFILDLIIFAFLAPVIYLLIKNKIVGFITLVGIYVLSALDLEAVNTVLMRTDALLYYCVGAYFGIHFCELFMNRINKRYAMCFGAVSVLCVVALFFFSGYEDSPVIKAVLPCVLTAYSLSLWYAYDIMQNKQYYNYEKDSFLVFTMHLNLCAVVGKLLYLALPKSQYFAPVNYVLNIIITMTVIVVFAYFLERKLPRVKNIITGRKY